MTPGPPVIDRSNERRVVVAGILLASGFLIAAVAATILPEGARRGIWLPLHLALAGGASTAIAAVMPFFVAAFVAAPPADPRLRAAAIVLIPFGALGIVAGVESGWQPLAVAGGTAFIAGIGTTGLALLQPVSRALGPSRGLVTRAYLAALVSVGVGATLATLLLAGWSPVAGDWLAIRASHAWLNLVGFVSLAIVTTLLHFFPTVVGARIVVRRTTRLAVLGVGGGAPLAAAGTLLHVPPLNVAGALIVAGGAAAQAILAWQTWRTRARWTTDAGWHRFSMGGLVSAIGWFSVGTLILAAGAIGAVGADPPHEAWSSTAVAGPLVVGWLGIAFLASATHLLPAVGPGTPPVHAAQRRLLGTAAAVRLVLLDLGCLLLTAGLLADGPDLTRGGLVLFAAGAGSTVVLLASAVAAGLRGRLHRP
jgi:nitrite reductase (NO-forming)